MKTKVELIETEKGKFSVSIGGTINNSYSVVEITVGKQTNYSVSFQGSPFESIAQTFKWNFVARETIRIHHMGVQTGIRLANRKARSDRNRQIMKRWQ